jgi:AcrR family transcriptional regulator
MRKAPIRHAKSESRRQEIRQAALACFAELGFDQTTMEDIRQRSQASTGSIYHHFKSKEQLAAAVYLEGIADYQSGFVATLSAQSGARAGIEAIVGYHLGWVKAHPDWARHLFYQRHPQYMADTEPTIQQLNRRFYQQVSDWFKPHIKAGRLRRLPPDIYSVVLLGPCQDFARLWLAGRTRTDIDAAAEALAKTTWQALKGAKAR